MRGRNVGSCALLLLAGACETTEPVVAGEVDGVPTDVEVLDAHFVRFEGRRIALEWFLLEIRDRVRAAAGDPARAPQVNVRVAPGAPGVDHRWIGGLRQQVQEIAGVRHMTLLP